MVFNNAARSILAAGCAVFLQAGGWDPIPPEVWAMKEDPAHGIVGAVVLERRMVFLGTGIRHLLRFRILSERGKAVAELPVFLPEATSIEGRTVQRDGTFVTFDKAKDFSEKSITEGQTERKSKVMLPPGLTGDCVVELRWVELAEALNNRQIPTSLGYSAEWWLGSPFLTRKLVVEFFRTFTWSASVSAGAGAYPELVRDGNHSTYTFTNIPAKEAHPFTMDSVSGSPSVRVYFQPEVVTHYAHNKPEDFWDQAAEWFIKPYYSTRLKKGKAYASLSRELLEGLPPDPAQAADLLCRRLDRRIVNQDWATLEEEARLKKREKALDFDPCDLESAASKGRTQADGMAYLYLALAGDAGLHPRLALVKDRNRSLFQFTIPDPWQLDAALIGIPLKDQKTFWVEPTLRFAQPGLIAPEFQGAEALVMETDKHGWHPRREGIEAQPPEFNRARYQFLLDLTGGEERITLRTGFEGVKELLERRKYLPLSKAEADRNLKEAMERGIRDAVITRASVLEAWTPDQGTRWEVEGKLELDATETLAVDPFPGMPAPLPLPTTWPDHRAVPIVMDYLRIQEGECELRLPPGYALQPVAPFQRQNRFGKVLFTAKERTPAVVDVQFRVEVRDLFEPASAEPQLRQFLAWVEEAYHRTLTLEKR